METIHKDEGCSYTGLEEKLFKLNERLLDDNNEIWKECRKLMIAISIIFPIMIAEALVILYMTL